MFSLYQNNTKEEAKFIMLHKYSHMCQHLRVYSSRSFFLLIVQIVIIQMFMRLLYLVIIISRKELKYEMHRYM